MPTTLFQRVGWLFCFFYFFYFLFSPVISPSQIGLAVKNKNQDTMLLQNIRLYRNEWYVCVYVLQGNRQAKEGY